MRFVRPASQAIHLVPVRFAPCGLLLRSLLVRPRQRLSKCQHAAWRRYVNRLVRMFPSECPPVFDGTDYLHDATVAFHLISGRCTPDSLSARLTGSRQTDRYDAATPEDIPGSRSRLAGLENLFYDYQR